MSEASSEHDTLSLILRLRQILASAHPYCRGTLELSPSEFDLYYGQKNASYINLSAASTDELNSLAQACAPAMFGRGEETVLDETYRKAGKMDVEHFLSRIDIAKIGLLSTVNATLLTGNDGGELNIRAELYKLNVYGEGAFFKPHKDTPHGPDMFGSLVIVFPTPHEGGALVLRHQGEEWTCDSSAMLAGRTNSVAYAAFFGDVEHEVLPVVSGHRVMLTYNLYYGQHPVHMPRLDVHGPARFVPREVEDALRALLRDPMLLPQGGTLGFALNHGYAFPVLMDYARWNPFKNLSQWLKGSDAALYQAWMALGITPKFRLISHNSLLGGMLINSMISFDHEDYFEGIESTLFRTYGSEVLKNMVISGRADNVWKQGKTYPDFDLERYDDEDEDPVTVRNVHWVTEPFWDAPTGPRTPFIFHGNEACLEWIYTNVCIVVDIPGAEQRRENGGEKAEEGSSA